MRGRFSCVSTASTPATRTASLASIRLMRPLAMLDVTTAACASPCVLYSAAYFAAPVTFARPSMRDVGVPIYVTISPDLLVRLRLRSALRGLRQRANDAAACKLDLEGIVRVAARLAQQHVGCAREARSIGRLSPQRRLRRRIAPRL